MKRVLAFASALALAVGAFAPAAFADDFVPAQIPLTDLYSDPELYDLYVAPYYNNLSFSDWGNYATDAVISGFPMDVVKQVETTEGGLESLWNTVHNAFQFGYNIGQDWVSKLYVDTSDGRLKSNGNIMTDSLKSLLDQYFKTTPSPSGGTVIINGHTWYSTPYTDTNGYYVTGSTSNSGSGSADVTIYYSSYKIGSRYYDVWCTWSTVLCYLAARVTPSWTSFSLINGTYSYNGQTYYCSNSSMSYRPTNTIVDYYNSFDAAKADFYANFVNPQTDPYWNGDGYYRDEYNVDIALPAIPAIDWKDLNNKYYTEYGGDFVEGDVNNFFYDISYNYYPAEYTYTVPYWLIDGNSTVLDFDYSLELPTVDLYELPSEFDGGEEVWDSSFTMLGGFGAFILLGFSFGLVALFFKD